MKYTKNNINGIRFVHKNEPRGKVYSLDMIVGDSVYINNHLHNYNLSVDKVIKALEEGTWIIVGNNKKKIYEIY